MGDSAADYRKSHKCKRKREAFPYHHLHQEDDCQCDDHLVVAAWIQKKQACAVEHRALGLPGMMVDLEGVGQVFEGIVDIAVVIEASQQVGIVG